MTENSVINLSDPNLEDSDGVQEYQEWAAKYDKVIKEPPSRGDVIRSLNNADIVINIEVTKGAPPFMYAKIYVPETFDEEIVPAWYARGTEDASCHGWKAILMRQARTALMQRYGASRTSIPVRAIKIIEVSRTGRSLKCEVAEYCEDNEPCEDNDSGDNE